MKHLVFLHQTCTTAQVPGQEAGCELAGSGIWAGLVSRELTHLERAASPGSEPWAPAPGSQPALELPAAPALQCPVWAPQGKRHIELLEQAQQRATELAEGSGASLLWGKAERAGPVSMAELTGRGPHQCKYLKGGREDGSRPFAVMPGNRTRGNGQEPIYRSPTWKWVKTALWCGCPCAVIDCPP